MKKNIYKLQVAWWNDDDEIRFENLYLDVNQIIGFSMFDYIEYNGENIQCIEIFTTYSSFKVMFEYHLYYFLKENFMDVAHSQEQENLTPWSHISL